VGGGVQQQWNSFTCTCVYTNQFIYLVAFIFRRQKYVIAMGPRLSWSEILVVAKKFMRFL